MLMSHEICIKSRMITVQHKKQQMLCELTGAWWWIKTSFLNCDKNEQLLHKWCVLVITSTLQLRFYLHGPFWSIVHFLLLSTSTSKAF